MTVCLGVETGRAERVKGGGVGRIFENQCENDVFLHAVKHYYFGDRGHYYNY